MKDYLYIYPNDYREDRKTFPGRTQLVWPNSGSNAVMRKSVLKRAVTVGPDRVYTYSNDRNGVKGHYGTYTLRSGGFTHHVRAWVFPDRFEILSYEANRPGDWVLRQNTLAFFAKNVNDLVFTIKYRPRAHATYESLRNGLEGQNEVELEQQETGVNVTLAETILFPSGSSELSESGKSVLTRVVRALASRPAVEIAVEGHTDNVPITGQLANVYPTNWELSSARALSVLRFLAQQGVAEEKLEMRVYGSTRPRASNQTDRGRAKNRRIELMIMENPKT